MYIVLCIVYSVQFTLYSLHCTNCILYSVQSKLYQTCRAKYRVKMSTNLHCIRINVINLVILRGKAVCKHLLSGLIIGKNDDLNYFFHDSSEIKIIIVADRISFDSVWLKKRNSRNSQTNIVITDFRTRAIRVSVS